MLKKILIVGGAGFIGKELTRSLLKSDYKIFIFDNLFFKQKFLIHKNIKNYKIDVKNKIKIKKLIKKINPEIIVNLAAVHSIPVCEKRRQLALQTNILGTENLLEASSIINLEMFIQASTGGVYNWNSKILYENHSSLEPTDNYTLTKFTNEKQINFWNHKTSNKYVLIRIFNTIGPDDPNGHLIPDILTQIDKKKNTNEIMLGNINPKRDYIDVRDVANAITKIIKAKFLKKLEIINICNQSNYSIRDILKILSKLLNTKIKVKKDQKRVRKVDRPHQIGSNKKMKNYINYKPKYSLENSLISILEKQ